MRLSQFFWGIATSRSLLTSSLALVLTALPACDSKSESDAAAKGATAEKDAVSPGLSTKGGSWKRSRPTNHTFTVKRTGRLPWSSSTASQSLRAAYVSGVQAEAGAEYAARPTRTGGTDAFRFDNRKQALAADLGQNGVRVDVNSKEASGSATFRLASVGCKGDAGSPMGAARPVSSDGRVSYQHAGVVEWYKNGPLGLEQGFDLAAAPACRSGSADQAIELKIAVDHRHQATLMHGKDGSQWLELRDGKKTVLRYSDLFAADADQKLLPTKMSFERDVLTLRIDDRGAKYPVRVDPLIWAQLNVRYKAGDSDNGDFFGSAVAISGNHAIVGAPFDDENCGTPDCNSGAAYIFTLNGQGVWTQQSKILGLKPVSTDPGGHLGAAVGITDIGGGEKRIVIGAPIDPGISTTMGPLRAMGLAVWFRGSDTTWIPEGQFEGDGEFGSSVGISSNRVIVGAPATGGDEGVAIIYEPEPSFLPPWAEARVIDDPGNFGRLGTSVAIDGDLAVVGAPACCDSGAPVVNVNQGVAYVYERNKAGMWDKYTGDLVASDGAADDLFGTSVALQGLTVVVGAPLSHSGNGGAYVFAQNIGVWGDQGALHDLVGLAPAEQFGRSVAIANNLIVVGSIDGERFGTRGGAAWVFDRTGINWSFNRKLYAVDPTPPHAEQPTDQELFGVSVAVDRERSHILIGASQNSDTASNSGAFYDFIQRKDLGDPCGAAAECATDLCVDGVCCDSVCGGGNPNDCMACTNTVPGMASLAPGLCGISDTSTVCHAQSDLCDRTVMCDGMSDTCGNAAQPAMTPCRPATGACDIAEVCDGTSTACPADAIRPVQTECRPAAGICDVAELCNGQEKSCPADLLKPSFTICRLPSGGECDSFEVCNGTSVDCPADVLVADNVACSAGSCQAGICRAEADLGITIGGPPSVEPNQDLTYTLTVTNYGRSTATNITVMVTLEKGATLVGSSGVPATCVSMGAGAQCTLASLDPQQSSPITLLVHPPGQEQTMNVAANVSAMLPDPNLANNTATLNQNLLSPRIAGGGAGCSTVPGGAAAASPFASLLGLLVLVARRRRRVA